MLKLLQGSLEEITEHGHVQGAPCGRPRLAVVPDPSSQFHVQVSSLAFSDSAAVAVWPTLIQASALLTHVRPVCTAVLLHASKPVLVLPALVLHHAKAGSGCTSD